MKNISKKLLICFTILSVPVISSCNKLNKATEDVLFAENYENLNDLKNVKTNKEDLVYDDTMLGEFKNLKHQQIFVNNELINNNEQYLTTKDDVKFLFYNDNSVRFVNLADGYQLDYKTNTTMNADFSISQYRSKIYNEESTITVSKEYGKNPYSLWSTYRDEWIIRYIDNDNFLRANNLKYSEDKIFESDSILKDHFVSIYSIVINDPGAIRKNYYNIAIVRESYDFVGENFYLFVMKSTSNKNKEFKEMIASFKKINSTNNPYNALTNMQLKENDNWNEQTKRYFNKLKTQQRTDWGIYTCGINDSKSDAMLVKTQNDLQEAMDYKFEILPTYMHVSNNNSPTTFPINMAKKHALGNGFNDKMVLQYSYQFTSTNNGVDVNNVQQAYTPMFDILRGKDDEYNAFDIKDVTHNTLERLAQLIKEYEAPILFRLNNEMNSDWVSYCGLMTLLDPDIFQATWRYLYNLFESYGVDNCIWIFNPIANTCPYSSWGEDLCYFPGNDYVHALGLTSYTDNNNGKANGNTFRENYTYIYNKSYSTFKNYPWIISEFACGAGGSSSGVRYRNQASQANYVKGMFSDFNNRENNAYLQNIKGAVWFSTNDYDSKGISNQYELVIEALPLTINEFKEGLKNNKLKSLV